MKNTRSIRRLPSKKSRTQHSRRNKSKSARGFQGRSPSKKQSIQLLFFHASWCPHCRTSEPFWKQFCNLYHKTKINGHVILCRDIETTISNQKTTQLMQKYDVNGIPTIVGILGSKVVKLNRTIDFESLKEFATSLGSN